MHRNHRTFQHRLQFSRTFKVRANPGPVAASQSRDLTIRQWRRQGKVAEKETSQPFKLSCAYPKSPSYLEEGNLSCSWREGTAPEFIQRWQNLLPCRSRSQVNLECGHSTSHFCWDGKAIYKNAWYTYRVVVVLFDVPVTVAVVVS